MSLNVYKASAGSGKTYTLALKYIALALATDDCRNFTHILAVTFTNKATGEMKDRILQYLFAIANKGYRTKDDEGFLQQLTNELKKSVDNKDINEDTIARRARNTLKAIMHDYDHFKVETIDSFFQSLLTSLAYEMKLTRGFKVDLENDAQITKAVNNLLLTIDQNPDKKLAEKIAHYQDNYMDENSKWDISTELIKFASDFLFNDVIMSHVEDLAKFTSNPKAMSELQGKLKAKVEEMKNKLKQMAEDESLNVLFYKSKSSSCNQTTIKSLCTFIDGLRKGILDVKDLSTTAKKTCVDPISIFTKNSYPNEDVVCAIKKVEEIDNFRTEALPLYNTCNLTLKKLDSLTLLGAIEHELTKESTESGTFLLSNTPQLFSDLVKEDDSSFIFEKLGTTIHHIMIDEFQDTSRKQWENFKKLLFEMLSQGRECMVVGDVKQSIYRWRGGDWEILKDIEVEKDFKERGIKVDTDPEKKLQADGTKKGNFNYRSLPNIVHFNNDFFKRIAQQEGEGSPIYDIYKDVAQEPKKIGEGFIRIERLPKTTIKGDMATEYVMDSLYEKIKELHSGNGNGYNIPYRDMTILVRGNKESEKLINYFNSKNDDDKPVFTTEEAFMYASSDMVSTIIYALKYFANPKEDTVSRKLLEDTYLRIVEASESQIDTNDLNELIVAISNTCEEPEASDAKKESAEDAASNKEVDRLVAQWKGMPIPEVIEQIIQRLHFNDMNDLGQSAYLYSFMDDVIQFVDNNTTDLKTFLKFWDDTLSQKAISTDSEDAISIMTIHKAKGLEKHTVFIPFADFNITNDGKDIVCDLQQMTKEENTPQLKDYVGNLSVVPIKPGKEMANSLYKNAYEEEHLQQTVDSINTLYVAFTRARANLFIWSRENSGGVYKYVDEYVKTAPADEYHLTCKHPVDNNDNVYEYGALERKEEKGNGNDKGSTNPFSSNKKIDDTTVNLCQCSLQNISFVQSGDSKDYIREVFAKDAVDELADKFAEAKRGTRYHDLFSRIITDSDLTSALENMQAEGLINADEAQEMQTVCQEAIDQQATEGHHWFDGTYEQVYNEREILYRRDNIVKTRRPDRFMVSDDKIVLIDYKFTKEEKNNKAKYQRQVATYMSDLQAIYHKSVEAYLWYISDDSESSIEAVKPTF